MDKEKAIQIIREEYQNGYSPTDIAQNLSQKLGAPFELVYQFVIKTLGEELQTGTPTTAEEPIPPPSPAMESELPVSPLPGYAPTPDKEANEPEIAPLAPIETPSLTPLAAPDLKALEQNPKVEKFVLQMIASHRKTSDAVLAVCEQTGLSWEEAQRLVARITAKNYKSLKSKQNRLPLILSAIALLVGALLAFAGISEAYTIYTVAQGAPSGEEMVMTVASQEFLRSAFWSLTTGGILLLGGAAGLFIALRVQFE